ncbi:MAG: outer membrane protein [Candidatus Nucleicultricaceae bacterium]
MKKFALIAFLTTGMTTGSMIATLGADKNDFGGFYMGANFGGGFGSTNSTLSTFDLLLPAPLTSTREQDLAVKGVRGGIHLGYDYMVTEMLLVGLEAFGDFSSHTGSVRQNIVLGDNYTLTLRRREAFGAAFRLGLKLTESTVPYLKIGVESAKWDMQFSSPSIGFDLVSSASSKKRHTGLVLGLGLETRVAKNWRLGVEWNFTKYNKPNDLSLSGTNTGFNQPLATAKSRDLITNDFRVRISYKF